MLVMVVFIGTTVEGLENNQDDIFPLPFKSHSKVANHRKHLSQDWL